MIAGLGLLAEHPRVHRFSTGQILITPSAEIILQRRLRPVSCRCPRRRIHSAMSTSSSVAIIIKTASAIITGKRLANRNWLNK
jgi:hypothetical protein